MRTINARINYYIVYLIRVEQVPRSKANLWICLSYCGVNVSEFYSHKHRSVSDDDNALHSIKTIVQSGVILFYYY